MIKKRVVFSLVVLGLLIVEATAQRPANPSATDKAGQVLQFFFDLQKNNKVLLGQDLGHGNVIMNGYQKYVTDLEAQTGKYLGFIAGDYGLDNNHNIDLTNQIFIDFEQKGGVVSLSWHFDNPWTGGSSWDTNNIESLWELITPGNNNNGVYNRWETQKREVANALRPLRDAGVPVLWRPLHEMNGDWFWWGEKNWAGHEDAYVAVWQDMFNYLTYDEGLDNLLWVYSTANTWERLLSNYYPGENYVDIVGIDIYGDSAESWFTQRDYQDLLALGNHPIGFTEFGPTLSNANGFYDYRRLLGSLQSNWPSLCFSLSWSNWNEGGREVKIAYVTNPNGLYETFSNARVITLDEMNVGGGGGSTTPPPVPAPTPIPTPRPVRPPTPSPTRAIPIPVPDPAPTPSPELGGGMGEVRFRNRWTGDYLTMTENNVGASVALAELNSVWYSQRWDIEDFGGVDNQYRIRCRWDDSFYLAIGEDISEAPAVASDRQEHWWSQGWHMEQVEGERTIYRLRNAWTGRYLGVDSANDWTSAAVFDLNLNWWSLQWVVEPLP